MALPAFQRMHNRLFARLGEQAVLRGNVACAANLEYGIVVDYEIGDDKFQRSEYAATVDIANIPAQYSPQQGDTLVMVGSGESYVIDAIAANNGFMARCVLRGA